MYCCLQQRKNFANRSRIDKVIVMVRVAPFFDSRCSSGHQPNCGIEQRVPPILSRAAITLDIGPHSSLLLFSNLVTGIIYGGQEGQ